METEKLLEILVCPACHASLEYLDNGKRGFLCPRCEKVYPIENDIPVMLIDKAIPLTDWNKGEKS